MEALQTGDRTFAVGLDVPHLNAAATACVDMPARIGDGDRAHHFAVAERADLARMARDSGAAQRIGWEGNGRHLPLGVHEKGIGATERKRYEMEHETKVRWKASLRSKRTAFGLATASHSSHKLDDPNLNSSHARI